LITFGILSGFVIHFSSDVIYALGLAGKIPILLAAWIPTLVTLMLSISFLLHQEGGE
jgi:lipopolysaccharide export system permease protein